MVKIPIIDKGKCRGCGLCLSVCNVDVIILIDNRATILKMMDCDWCTLCEAVYPNGAITCPVGIVIEDK
jgi:MinD superfamily P-loop ATPase